MKSETDWIFSSVNNQIYYIWCGFRTISLAKSVTWYTEYLMYFFHCEETKPLVSIFTYIDTIFLFLRSLVLWFVWKKMMDANSWSLKSLTLNDILQECVLFYLNKYFCSWGYNPLMFVIALLNLLFDSQIKLECWQYANYLLCSQNTQLLCNRI
jgi:hypothetical protein